MELHGREMADEFCLKIPNFHVTFRDLLLVVNLRHGTHGFTSPPKEGVLRFEPANLGTKDQHATSRLRKPLDFQLTLFHRQVSKRSKFHGNAGFLLCKAVRTVA